MTTHPARIALIGDRSPHVLAHARIPDALRGAAPDPEAIDPYWLGTDRLPAAEDLAAFDGVWAVPGSPYRDRDAVLEAIGAARRLGIPFLGTCAGFQHAVLEFARSVAGLRTAEHGEDRPDAEDQLLVPLACSLLGEEAVVEVLPSTKSATLLGPGPRTERYVCTYGVDPARQGALAAAGLIIAGCDQEGDIRIVELADHPYFLACLFQPELAPDGHPVIAGFVDAATARAAMRRPVG